VQLHGKGKKRDRWWVTPDRVSHRRECDCTVAAWKRSSSFRGA